VRSSPCCRIVRRQLDSHAAVRRFCRRFAIAHRYRLWTGATHISAIIGRRGAEPRLKDALIQVYATSFFIAASECPEDRRRTIGHEGFASSAWFVSFSSLLPLGLHASSTERASCRVESFDLRGHISFRIDATRAERRRLLRGLTGFARMVVRVKAPRLPRPTGRAASGGLA
jgi:hypothetical protein